MAPQPTCAPSDDETIRAAFAAFDADGSGSIDSSELLELVESLGGILSPDEFQAALKLLDKDGNGVISYDEFAAWWQQAGDDLDGDGATGELEKALSRLKELGQQRYHVDIHTACWKGDVAVVERLLEHDVVNDRDATEFGDMNTPLHYAAYQGHLALCRLLIEKKAKINTTNAVGCTALFFASQQEHTSVVKYLLEQGADAKLRESEHLLSAVDVTSSMAVLDTFRAIAGEKPSPPPRVDAKLITATSITITWTAASAKLNESLPLSGFKIKATAPGKKTCLQLAGTNPLQATLVKLTPETTYSIQVAAVSLHGASEYGPPLLETTLAGPAVAPGRATPRGNTATIRNQSTIRPEASVPKPIVDPSDVTTDPSRDEIPRDEAYGM